MQVSREYAAQEADAAAAARIQAAWRGHDGRLQFQARGPRARPLVVALEFGLPRTHFIYQSH